MCLRTADSWTLGGVGYTHHETTLSHHTAAVHVHVTMISVRTRVSAGDASKATARCLAAEGKRWPSERAYDLEEAAGATGRATRLSGRRASGGPTCAAPAEGRPRRPRPSRRNHKSRRACRRRRRVSGATRRSTPRERRRGLCCGEEERPALPGPAERTDAAGERTATARKEGEKENVQPTSFWERSRTFELRPNAAQAAQAAQLAAEMWAAHSCAGAAVAKGLVAETIDRADDIVRVTRTSAARHSEPR